jgi:hypothetical protein
MVCDICRESFDYCFYINDEHWLRAVGRKEGHWCAHCILQKLGGFDWYITFNEPASKMRLNMAEAE